MSTLVFSPAPSAMTTPTRNDPLPLPLPPSRHADSRPGTLYTDMLSPPPPPKRTISTPPPRRGSLSPLAPSPRRDSIGGSPAVRRHLTPPPSTQRMLSSQLPSPTSPIAGRGSKSPSPVPSRHRPTSAATEALDSPFAAPRSAPSMPLPTLAPLIIHPPSLSTESALSSPASSTRGLLLTPPLSPSRISTLTPTHTSITSTIVFPLINVPMSVPPSLRPAVSPMRYHQILTSFQSCYVSHQRQIIFHKGALAFSLFNVFISYVLLSIRSLRVSDLPIILAYMIVSALLALVATINWYAADAAQLDRMEDLANKLNREAMEENESDDEDEGIDVGVQVHTVSRRGRQAAARERRSIWLPSADTTLDAMWSVARDPVVKCNVVVKITVHGPISLLGAYGSLGPSRAGEHVAQFSPTGLSGTTFTGENGSPLPVASPSKRDIESVKATMHGPDFLAGKPDSRPPLGGDKPSLASQPPPTTSIMRSSLMSYSSDRQLMGPHPPLPTHNRPPSVQSPHFATQSPRRTSVASTTDHLKAQPRYPPANNPVFGGRRPSLVSLLNEGPLVPTQYPKAHTMPLPPSSKNASPSSISPLEAAAAAASLGPGSSYGTVPGRRPSDASVASSNLPPQFRHLFASLDRPLDRRPSFALLPPAKSRPPLLGDLDLGPSQLLEAIEEASSSLEQSISTSKKARPDTVATSMVEADSLVALYTTSVAGSIPPTPTRSSTGWQTSLSVIAAQLRMGPWVDVPDIDDEQGMGQEQAAAGRLHDQSQRELERLQEELKELELEVSKP